MFHVWISEFRGMGWKGEINPLNAELNPICKSQLAELFCGVFTFCTRFSKKLLFQELSEINL